MRPTVCWPRRAVWELPSRYRTCMGCDCSFHCASVLCALRTPSMTSAGHVYVRRAAACWQTCMGAVGRGGAVVRSAPNGLQWSPCVRGYLPKGPMGHSSYWYYFADLHETACRVWHAAFCTAQAASWGARVMARAKLVWRAIGQQYCTGSVTRYSMARGQYICRNPE